jgi:membrane protease YdiL (CAAX protease family)
LDLAYYVGFFSEWLGAIAVTWLFSLSPRFRKPQIGFKYARRDGLVALSLYVLILAAAFILYSVNPPSYPSVVNATPSPVVPLQRAILTAGVCVLPFLVALFTRKQPVRSTGWNPALFAPSLQMGFGIAILTIFLRNRVIDVLTHLDQQHLTVLLLAIGISLAEETIFRGFIQLRLAWWLGKWPGIALTALAFTLWHVPAWLNHLPVETGLIVSGLTFIQGIILGWIMNKSGNIIAPTFYRSISIWMNFFV